MENVDIRANDYDDEGGAAVVLNGCTAGNEMAHDRGFSSAIAQINRQVHARQVTITGTQSNHDTLPSGAVAWWVKGGSLELSNALVVDNSIRGAFPNIAAEDGGVLDLTYVDSLDPAGFDRQGADLTGVDGNLSADSLFVDVTGDTVDWDLRLDVGSPAIDVGDPTVLDADGCPSVLGAFGGPFGQSW